MLEYSSQKRKRLPRAIDAAVKDWTLNEEQRRPAQRSDGSCTLDLGQCPLMGRYDSSFEVRGMATSLLQQAGCMTFHAMRVTALLLHGPSGRPKGKLRGEQSSRTKFSAGISPLPPLGLEVSTEICYYLLSHPRCELHARYCLVCQVLLVVIKMSIHHYFYWLVPPNIGVASAIYI